MTVLATEVPIDIGRLSDCPEPQRPIEVAVVGLGRLGIEHAAVLSTIPGCSVIAVVDPERGARRNARGMGFSAADFPSVEKMFARSKPEAVWVCESGTRGALSALRALEAGASVFVDAPLAPLLRDTEAWVEMAERHEARLAFAHPLAFHPVFSEAHRLIEAGIVGRTRQVRSSMYLSRVFSAAHQRPFAVAGAPGGVVAHAASDLLFVLLRCFGMPRSVHATWNRIYGDLEDELHGMLTLDNGTEVGFDSSWSVPGYPRPASVIELEGDRGKMLAADDALELELLEPRAGFAAGTTRIGHDALPQPARFDRSGETRYLEDATFLAWAAGGPAPPNRADRAILVRRTIDALYASARDGGRIVEIPPAITGDRSI